jgi:N-acylneuraminate cytidylyltransferase
MNNPSTNSPWTAFIPIRGGSKGLPNKNTLHLSGKPLYRHAVDLALEAGAHQVIISTDIPEVLSAVLPQRVQVIDRPSNLCGDNVPMAPVLIHALEDSKCKGVLVLLQATSPLRQVTDINNSLNLFATGQYDLVISVTDADRGVLKWGQVNGDRFIPISRAEFCFANRQNLPSLVKPNGAIYVMDAHWFLANGDFVSDHIGATYMSKQRSVDIDTLEDLKLCEAELIFLKQTKMP